MPSEKRPNFEQEILTSLEEAIIRMRRAADKDSNDAFWVEVDEATKKRLRLLELRAFERTGRIEELLHPSKEK